jgi:CBS domain-containing protein
MVELDHIRVGDAMHHGILSCAADTPLGEVAGIMCEHQVHAVALTAGEGTRPAGIVSDLDVIAALATGEEATAAEAAATEALAVSENERLGSAAQLMREHGVSHLVVLDAADGHPVGILSTLDMAAVYTDGAEP